MDRSSNSVVLLSDLHNGGVSLRRDSTESNRLRQYSTEPKEPTNEDEARISTTLLDLLKDTSDSVHDPERLLLIIS